MIVAFTRPNATLPMSESAGVADCAGPTPIPIFQTVLNGITLRGSIVGTHQDLTEVFQLHRLGRTRVFREQRPLERVNEAFTEVLEGSAATPRLVFAI